MCKGGGICVRGEGCVCVGMGVCKGGGVCVRGEGCMGER